MSFAQNMQAYIIDRYYRYLHEAFPAQAEDAILTAFHLYMFQQGSRGAMRAVRDGNPLDFVNYQRYREVSATPEMIKNDSPHEGKRSLSPELFESRTSVCSVHRLFTQLESPKEAERLFCHNIDEMNVEGFNPHIPYKVETILCDSEVCLQRCPDPGCPSDTDIRTRKPDAPPFPFLLANQFVSMGKVIAAIFGEEGRRINDLVVKDFIQRYGQEDYDQIAVYLDSDFEIPYPLGLAKK